MPHPSKSILMNLSTSHNQFSGFTLILGVVTQHVEREEIFAVWNMEMQSFLLFLGFEPRRPLLKGFPSKAPVSQLGSARSPFCCTYM
jgi:hypothetical protein